MSLQAGSPALVDISPDQVLRSPVGETRPAASVQTIAPLAPLLDIFGQLRVRVVPPSQRPPEKALPTAAMRYVVGLCMVGYGCLLYSLSHIVPAALHRAWPFVLLSVLGSAAQISLRPVAKNSTTPSRGGVMSVNYAFTFAAMLYGGTAVGALAGALTGLLSPIVRRRSNPLFRTLFNGASLALSAWAAGTVYNYLSFASGDSRPQYELLGVFAATYVYYLVNTWSVAVVMALVKGSPPVPTWIETYLWTAPGYLIGSAVAVGMVSYYEQLGALVFVGTLPALIVTHRSYQSYLRNVEELQKRYDEVQKLYQESLVLVTQSEKMASIGTLAGGIAHEINNPLMVILGRTELVLSDLAADDPSVRDLEVIEAETRRIAGIVGELLRFSRQDNSVEFLPVDINEVIARALHLTQYQLKVDNVAIDTGLEPDLPAVMGNAGRLQQVLTNMVVNGYHSMRPRGGRLSIRTWHDLQQVFIRISDTGCGIPAQNVSRIFEPFFTTKSNDEGTGLGLAVSYGIVREHSGHIDVESTEGQGTTFTIRLPVQPVISHEAAGAPAPLALSTASAPVA